MEFEYGNEQNPKGNCFLYCAVQNDFYYFPNTDWIAANIYISSLPVNDRLPVVAFPPIGVESPQKVFDLAKARGMDVIRIPDFIPPSDKEEAKKYFHRRINEFNDLIMAYVEICNQSIRPVGENYQVSNEDEASKLDALEKRFLKALIANPDQSALNMDVILGPYLFDTIVQDKKYDFHNLQALLPELEPDQGDIVRLFFDKFRAIYHEEYEMASFIQQEIDGRIHF